MKNKPVLAEAFEQLKQLVLAMQKAIEVCPDQSIKCWRVLIDEAVAKAKVIR